MLRAKTIAGEITRLVTGVSALAVCLIAAVLALHEAVSFHDRMRDELQIVARVLAENSAAALVFDDSEGAQTVLASLHSLPHVVSAQLLRPDGRVLARYAAAGHTPEDVAAQVARGAVLRVSQPVMMQNKSIGMLHLQARLDAFYAQLWQLLWLAGAALSVVLVLAYVAARRLQHSITRPIVQLARVTQRITDERDFSVRVEQERDGELAALTMAFNAMLTEVEQRQTQLEHARDDLEQRVVERTADLAVERDNAAAADRAKTEFLANMSHEIRTPMTAILGFSDLLLDPHLDTAEKMAHVDVIRRNGRHLLSVINDILDLTKIEAGKMTVECLECELVPLIGDIVSLMGGKAREKGLTLQATCTAPIPARIRTDPTRLRQMLLNLVGNAIKFTERGGIEIGICVGPLPQAASGDTREVLCFAIKDTGIGLAEAQLEAIFRPFEQADTSTTRCYGGTGLGLAITRRLACMLGGGVAVQSVQGLGSVFTLWLEPGDITAVERVADLSKALVVTGSAAMCVAAPTKATKVRVLLAEDSRDNQRLIGFHLKRAGMVVEIVANGAAARDRVLAEWRLETPFDVVLMDMQMPVLDGYSATSQLRQAGYSGPIVALTAHAMSGDRDKCLQAGCDQYATKPIQAAQLVAIIESFAPERGQAAAA